MTTTDTRQKTWNVRDEESQSVIASYNNLAEARALCEVLEPNGNPREGYRYTCEKVLSS
jgi:hypothetical protein